MVLRRGDSAGNQGHLGQSHAAEVEALSKAVEGQKAAVQEATAQRQAAEDRARRLQQEVDRLSSELQEAGPASDLQRQFREVRHRLSQLSLVFQGAPWSHRAALHQQLFRV